MVTQFGSDHWALNPNRCKPWLVTIIHTAPQATTEPVLPAHLHHSPPELLVDSWQKQAYPN